MSDFPGISQFFENVGPMTYTYGMKELVYKKPSVSSTTWSRVFHNRDVEMYTADKYQYFYKVVVKDQRPKYFFGETAYHDAQRYASDNTDWRSGLALAGYDF